MEYILEYIFLDSFVCSFKTSMLYIDFIVLNDWYIYKHYATKVWYVGVFFPFVLKIISIRNTNGHRVQDWEIPKSQLILNRLKLEVY